MPQSKNSKSSKVGSQRLLQLAVEKHPELLLRALKKANALGRGNSVNWTSPREADEYKEFRDSAALRKLGVIDSIIYPLKDFWPQRGPVWDATGITNEGRPVLLEAKAHIPEAASPKSGASPKSLELIESSLERARKYYTRKSTANWSGTLYQYANRLAHHYYLRELNNIPSVLIFLDFINATDMDGPKSVLEWQGATRLMHAMLGLPKSLESFDVYHVCVDAAKVQG